MTKTIQIGDQLIEYYRVESAATHNVAASSCDALPGSSPGEFTLPVPDSLRENDFYLSLLDPIADGDSKGRSRFWLGITRKAGGTWQRDDGTGGISFTNWNPNEGVDARTLSVAAAMLKTNGLLLGEWVDVPNDARAYIAICTKKTTVTPCKNIIIF